MEFVETLRSLLLSNMNASPGVYYDLDLKQRAGVKYPQELAQQICRSATLVASLTSEYMESSWCRAEWE